MGVWDRRDTWGTEIWGSLWTHNGSHVCACPPPPSSPQLRKPSGRAQGFFSFPFSYKIPFWHSGIPRNSLFVYLISIIVTFFSFSHPEMGGGVEGSESTPPLSPLLMPDSSCQHLEVTQQMVTAVTPTLINYIIIIIDLETGGV